MLATLLTKLQPKMAMKLEYVIFDQIVYQPTPGGMDANSDRIHLEHASRSQYIIH